MTGPDIKPKLKRGVDTYTANLQGKKDHFVTIERDGDEWVRLDPWNGKPQRWFATLTEFRRWVADTNVSRWASSGDPEGGEFILWARKRVGGRACAGERRSAAGGLTVLSHGDCCHWLLKRPMPEGLTMLDLYEEWVSGR